MEPTAEELITLQDEMFSVLSSQHSKPVNSVLGYCKKIAAHPQFEADAFLQHVRSLLSNPTKNVVAATLILLEKAATKNEALIPDICTATVSAFIHNSDELQSRAAKLITKYENKLPEDFSSTLSVYNDNLLSAPRLLLQSILQLLPTQDNNIIKPPSQHHQEKHAITTIDSIDDLIYFASQAFDNNATWHFDLLPAALIQNVASLKGIHIQKFEPALQRALNLTKTWLNSTQGHLEHMLAIFFIDVCIHLARKNEADADALYQLFLKYQQKDGVNIADWMQIPKDTCYLQKWSVHSKDPFYEPFRMLLLYALEKFLNEDTLPLLSTPTHTPAYVSPVALVERLSLYQNSQTKVNNIDLQIAISRCDLSDVTEAVQLTEKLLKGEFRLMMLFLLRKDIVPTPYEYPAAWLCAALNGSTTRSLEQLTKWLPKVQSLPRYLGQITWEITDDYYNTTEYDYLNQKMVEKQQVRKVMLVRKMLPLQEKKGVISKLFGKLTPANAAVGEQCLYDYFSFKATWMGNEFACDLKRAILLAPGNPALWLAEEFADAFKTKLYIQLNAESSSEGTKNPLN
jgi:hypothetical protein